MSFVHCIRLREVIIASTWSSAGYKISYLDLDNRKISFCKFDAGSSQLVIPQNLTEKKLPNDAIFELVSFFDYIVKNMVCNFFIKHTCEKWRLLLL